MTGVFTSNEKQVAAKDNIEISDEMADWLHQLRAHFANGATILQQAEPEQQDHMLSRSMDLMAVLLVIPDPEPVIVAAIIANFAMSMAAALECNDVYASAMSEANGETKQ